MRTGLVEYLSFCTSAARVVWWRRRVACGSFEYDNIYVYVQYIHTQHIPTKARGRKIHAHPEHRSALRHFNYALSAHALARTDRNGLCEMAMCLVPYASRFSWCFFYVYIRFKISNRLYLASSHSDPVRCASSRARDARPHRVYLLLRVPAACPLVNKRVRPP